MSEDVSEEINREKTPERRVIRRHTTSTLHAILVALAALTLLFAFSPQALADGGAEAAAREAAARYDARVLDVKTAGDQYRVKLLLPSGKIKVVFVPRSDDADADGGARRPKGARPESRGMPVDSMREMPFSEGR